MRLCRFGNNRLGVVQGDRVRDVTGALDVLPAIRYPLPLADPLIANLDPVTKAIDALLPNAPTLSLAGLTLLSPVGSPRKIIAAPVNYQEHLDEARGDVNLHQNKTDHLLPIHKAGVFLKAASSLVGPGEGIAVCKPDRRTDHEIELVFVIGKEARDVSKEAALDYVAGYGI